MVDEAFDWGGDAPPRMPLADTVVYEAHVRTHELHPELPEDLRGTYAGLAHPVRIAYLKELGVTTVELLPVHAFTSRAAAVQRGPANYWGYNTLGFFAPHADVRSRAADPQGVLDEFKGMVRLLHEAGSRSSSTSSTTTPPSRAARGRRCRWRGLDNRAYYRLDDRGRTSTSPDAATPSTSRHAVVPPAGARLAAVLGERVPRRRLPVRPRAWPWAAARRRLRPRPPVARGDAHRPGAVAASR